MARGIWRRSPGLATLLALEFTCLVLVSYQIQVDPRVSLLEKAWMLISNPVQHASHASGEYISDRFNRSKERSELVSENQTMARKLAYMERLEVQKKELELENRRLHKLLQLEVAPSWEPVAASVVGRVRRGGDSLILINRGSSHGLRADLGVVAPAGVVGVVWEVTPFYSKIITLNNPATAVAAMLQASRYADAYLHGNGPSRGRLENVPNFAQVETRGRVITSGLDGLFPKGELLGWVGRHQPSAHMFQEIDVQLAVDFASIEEVVVLVPKRENGESQ